jgi:hypothetical protein
MAFSQFHYDVQEIHAVQFHLLAKRFGIIEVREVLIRSYLTQNIIEINSPRGD